MQIVRKASDVVVALKLFGDMRWRNFHYHKIGKKSYYQSVTT